MGKSDMPSKMSSYEGEVKKFQERADKIARKDEAAPKETSRFKESHDLNVDEQKLLERLKELVKTMPLFTMRNLNQKDHPFFRGLREKGYVVSCPPAEWAVKADNTRIPTFKLSSTK